MAIYFNNKVLVPNENGTDIEKHFFKTAKEVKEMFDELTGQGEQKMITFHRNVERRQNMAKTGYASVPAMTLPFEGFLNIDNLGIVQVRYTRLDPVWTGDKYMFRDDPSLALMTEDLVIDKKDWERAWFIIHCTPFIKKGTLTIVNKKHEYVNTFEETSRMLKYQQMLFGENVTLEQLQYMAENLTPYLTYDVKTKEEYATKLWAEVYSGEMSKNDKVNFEALLKVFNNVKAANDIQTSNNNSKEPYLHEVEINGNEVRVMVYPCPRNVNEDNLDNYLTSKGVDITGLDKNIKYSIKKHIEAL